MKYTLFDVAAQVEQLRNAQNLWGILIQKANRTGLVEDFAEANRVSVHVNEFATTVDATIKDITENQIAGDKVMIDMKTYQDLIDSENDALAENARLKKINDGVFEILEDLLKAHPEGSGIPGMPHLRDMIFQLKQTTNG